MIKWIAIVSALFISPAHAQVAHCMHRAQVAYDIAISIQAGTPVENINALFNPAPSSPEKLNELESWWKSLREEVALALESVGQQDGAAARAAQSVLEKCAQEYGKHRTASSERFLAGSVDNVRIYECHGRLSHHAIISRMRSESKFDKARVIGELNENLKPDVKAKMIALIEESFSQEPETWQNHEWQAKYLRACVADHI